MDIASPRKNGKEKDLGSDGGGGGGGGVVVGGWGGGVV